MTREAQSANRQWAIALTKARRLESVWQDARTRLREIIALRHWLEEQSDIERLAGLARILREEMSRRDLEAILAPIERMTRTRRVTDITVLTDDISVDEDFTPDIMPLTIVADSLRSAFNIGSLFRSAECFGAQEILLCGYSATPETEQVAKTALGTEKHVAWRTGGHLPHTISALKAGGVRTFALETANSAVPLGDFSWHFPCAVILGNERFGLDEETIVQCDACIKIPMYGRKNSLNVATAAAILLNSARDAYNLSREMRDHKIL